MSKNTFSIKESHVVSEAAAWLAQLETGSLSAADKDAFREWMHRSPRHVAEIRKLARLSKNMNMLTDLAEPLSGVTKSNQPFKEQGASWAKFQPVALSLIVLIGVVAVLAYKVISIEPEIPVIVQTAIGETREIELPDGSKLKLNTNSSVEVDYNEKARDVRLLSGEVYFDVVPNINKPFFVYTSDKYIRVVGTAFLVRLFPQDFELTVTKGRVELVSQEISKKYRNTTNLEKSLSQGDIEHRKEKLITLEAGQSISILVNQEVGEVVKMSERELQRELSWQEGLHDFSNTPLEEVIWEISRYTSMDIEIVDPEVRNLKLGGLFRIGETEALLDVLSSEFGIYVEYIDDQKVRLSLAKNKQL